MRKSELQQVLNHIESRQRQYALVDLAVALGSPGFRILLIDEDQGNSGKTADRRTGFHRLLAEVTMDHVGLILGIEMSRVARNNKDWHHLMEMCAIFGTLLADEDRIYDPRDAEDRLLLGFKGTISEYELVLMHNRLERGRLHKANRCALFLDVPCGYVKLPTGEVARDPDEQVQATVQLVFDKFDELGSCRRVYRHLIRNKIRLGMRLHRGPRRGQLEWRLPSPDTVSRMLHHPIYAGAYSYGRRHVDHKRTAASGGKLKSPGTDVGVDGAPTGPPAGLYHVGTVRGQAATVAAEQPAARFSGGAPHRQGAVDEPAGLRGMWPAHVRQLSEQVDRLLWVYAEEERGINVLRTRSRGGGRSRGPAGFACPRARQAGVEPESDPGCAPRA